MRRDAALARLRSLEARLRRQGVAALFLFGSVARDDADDQSDIDLAFDLPPDTAFSLFEFEADRDSLDGVAYRLAMRGASNRL
jgi:predicted nucleotidyltransferase